MWQVEAVAGLCNAVQQGNLGSLTEILSSHDTAARLHLIAMESLNGWNAVSTAAVAALFDTDALELLMTFVPEIQCAQLITTKNLFGYNSMHTAIEHGASTKAIEKLLSYVTSDTEKEDVITGQLPNGMNCFHLALCSQENCYDYLKTLVKFVHSKKVAAALLRPDILGNTCIHLAVKYQRDPLIVRYVISLLSPLVRGIALAEKNCKGENILHFAVKVRPDPLFIKHLVSTIGDERDLLNLLLDEDTSMLRPLALTCEVLEGAEIVEVFLDPLDSVARSICIAAQDKLGYDFIHTAIVRTGSSTLVKRLLEALDEQTKADVLMRQCFMGFNCLHSAIRTRNFNEDLISFILNEIQSIHQVQQAITTRDYVQGNNCITSAVSLCRPLNTITLLCNTLSPEQRLDLLSQKNNLNETPLAIAEHNRRKSYDVTEYFRCFTQSK